MCYRIVFNSHFKHIARQLLLMYIYLLNRYLINAVQDTVLCTTEKHGFVSIAPVFAESVMKEDNMRHSKLVVEEAWV